jgi:hypothetical protein
MQHDVLYLIVISCLESYLNTTFLFHMYSQFRSVPIVSIRYLIIVINKTDVLWLSIFVLIIPYPGNNYPVICTKELTATLNLSGLGIAKYSPNGPLWYVKRWQLHTQW